MTGHSLDEAIEKEFSGNIRDSLKAILQCSIDKTEFFASRLYKSMKGLGTNDSQLIRLIVGRSEIDLKDIKLAFERLYGKSLRSWIKVKFSRPQINITLRISIENYSSFRWHIWKLQKNFICTYWRRTSWINLNCVNCFFASYFKSFSPLQKVW